jgi:Ca-activated chloride channel homolog
MFNFLNDATFANPELFYLLILIPLMTAWYVYKEIKKNPSLKISTFQAAISIKPTMKVRLRHSLFVLQMLAFGLLVVALARPQSSTEHKNVYTEGIDIVITMDISSSMLAEDLKPNRMEAAKENAIKFVEERVNDRIGVVVFASESFTQCPITIDHDIIKNVLAELTTDLVMEGIIKDGTAIGDGLSNAISRLKDSKTKSKVVVLLTDGMNNSGKISPETAADLAEMYNIRVYTIGVGTKGKAPYPYRTRYGTKYQNVEVKIDEKILKEIANRTGGKYFRATNNKSLANVYKDIDTLEKTKMLDSAYRRYSELFHPFAIAAAVLFVLSILLQYLFFRKFP